MADFERLKVPDITIDGTDMGAELTEQLIDLRVHQARSLPDAFTMRFEDPTFDVLTSKQFAIGKVVNISFSDEDETTVVTEAEITAVGLEQGTGGRHELIVSGLNKAHRLTRGTKVRTFQDSKDSDIVSTIAGDYGLSAQTDDSGTLHAYIVQNKSDYDFLTERAQAVGFDWWVEGKKLHFKKRVKQGSPKTLTWGEDLYKFKVRFSAAEAVTKVNVRGWDPKTQKAFVGNATPKTDAAAIGTDAPAAAAFVNDMKKFKGERFAGPALALDSGEAKALATAAAQRGTADEVVARGEAEGEPGIKPGIEVKIENMGDQLSGKYFVTSVEHYYQVGARYRTRFVCGGQEPSGLVDLLSRSGANGQRFGIGGYPMIGVVTNNTDEDGNGRVKVKFPAYSDDDESDWARVSLPGAGKERGLQLIPEVDDEVLVAFEHGDPRRPIVLGGLWSAKKGPAVKSDTAVKSKKVELRTWQSRLGHKIEMMDGTSPAKKSVTVELSDGKTILAMAEDKVTLDSPSDITITGKKKINVKATSDVTIEGMNITLKATSKLVLDAAQIEIKGKASVKVEGAMTDIKGKSMLKMDGGPMAQLKGGIVKIN